MAACYTYSKKGIGFQLILQQPRTFTHIHTHTQRQFILIVSLPPKSHCYFDLCNPTFIQE